MKDSFNIKFDELLKRTVTTETVINEQRMATDVLKMSLGRSIILLNNLRVNW